MCAGTFGAAFDSVRLPRSWPGPPYEPKERSAEELFRGPEAEEAPDIPGTLGELPEPILMLVDGSYQAARGAMTGFWGLGIVVEVAGQGCPWLASALHVAPCQVGSSGERPGVGGCPLLAREMQSPRRWQRGGCVRGLTHIDSAKAHACLTALHMAMEAGDRRAPLTVVVDRMSNISGAITGKSGAWTRSGPSKALAKPSSSAQATALCRVAGSLGAAAGDARDCCRSSALLVSMLSLAQWGTSAQAWLASATILQKPATYGHGWAWGPQSRPRFRATLRSCLAFEPARPDGLARAGRLAEQDGWLDLTKSPQPAWLALRSRLPPLPAGSCPAVICLRA